MQMVAAVNTTGATKEAHAPSGAHKIDDERSGKRFDVSLSLLPSRSVF
jgi:hypothetical protein